MQMKRRIFLLAFLLVFCILDTKATNDQDNSDSKNRWIPFMAVAALLMIGRNISNMIESRETSTEPEKIRPTLGDKNLKKILSIYEKKESLNKAEYEQKINEIIDRMINSISNESDYNEVVQLLKETQIRNIFSEDYYLNKHQEFELIFKELQIKKLIESKSKTLVDDLITQKEKGLISENEFLEKKNRIIENVKINIEQDLKSKPSLSDIDEQIKEKLSSVKMNRLEYLLSIMENGDVIVLYDNKINIIDKNRWTSINDTGLASKYEIIFQRN